MHPGRKRDGHRPASPAAQPFRPRIVKQPIRGGKSPQITFHRFKASPHDHSFQDPDSRDQIELRRPRRTTLWLVTALP